MGYYPVTPSTQIAENLDLMKSEGLHDISLIAAEGEHSAAGICYGASALAAGVCSMPPALLGCSMPLNNYQSSQGHVFQWS